MKSAPLVQGAGCLSLLVLCQTALATDVLRMEGFGPISRGMGGTSMAFDTGTAALVNNPATLTLAPQGSRFSIGMDYVDPHISTKDENTGEVAKSQDASKNRGPYYAPQLAYTYHDERWAWGVGAFAEGGLGTQYGSSSFLSNGSSGAPTGLDNSSRLLVLDMPLGVSFDVNDQLTIGGSIDAMWAGMNLNMLLGANQIGGLIGDGRASGSLIPVLGGLPSLDGAQISFSKNQPLASGAQAWGYGGRLGLLWKVTPTTNIGVAYNFKSHLGDLKGDAQLTAVDTVVGQIPLSGKIRVEDFQMPAVFSTGISHAINDRWLVTADISRVFWRDVLKDINVSFVSDQGGDLNLKLPQNYHDQTVFAVGSSYRLGDWTFRGGYRQGTKVADSSLLFATLPVTPTRHISAGLSYQVTAASAIDVAYTHAYEKTTSNDSLPNTAVPIENSHSQDNFVLGYTYSF